MKRITNIDSGFVCHCARIRHSELLEIFSEAPDPSYEEFKVRYGIGGQCASCEYEVKAILDDYLAARGPRVTREVAPARVRSVPVSARCKSWAQALRRKIVPKVNTRTCMFYIIDDDLRSSLVISNINNPESNSNPNQDYVSFRILIYDGRGQLVHQTGRLRVGPNETVEFFPEDIFAKPPDRLVGSMYVEYFDLECTNTLRPYCVLNHFDAKGRVCSRQHYHDKYYTGVIPGFVQCPNALPASEECKVAMVNCSEKDFHATLCLRLGGEVKKTDLHFGPRWSEFRSVREIFGSAATPETMRDAHFWIESDQYVMTYFFWHDPVTDVWFGRHH